MRGGARWPHARRTLCGSLVLARISGFARLASGFGSPSVSVRLRAPHLRRWALIIALVRKAEDDLGVVVEDLVDVPGRQG